MKTRDSTYLHYRVAMSNFETLCGKVINEVRYWAYYSHRENAPDDLLLCPECEDWSNLVELAKTEL